MRFNPSSPVTPLLIPSTPMTRSYPAFLSSPMTFASTDSGVTMHTVLKSLGAGWSSNSEWRRTRAPGRYAGVVRSVTKAFGSDMAMSAQPALLGEDVLWSYVLLKKKWGIENTMIDVSFSWG